MVSEEKKYSWVEGSKVCNSEGKVQKTEAATHKGTNQITDK